MKFAKLLFKPKWQEKNADIRRVAVATDNDPDLIAALPELLRSDPDATVRLAALKRLDDYEFWRERSTNDADNGLRRTARAAYLTRLCSDSANVPVLPRRIAELETLSADELEKVASIATNRELRADALTRISKPAFLGERALNDPDPALRMKALERIVDAGQLERIAERARKTDKVISRIARERAVVMRIERGDKKTISDRALALCERIETLMRTAGSQSSMHLATIEHEWLALGPAIPADIAARYVGARSIILAPAPIKKIEIQSTEPEVAITAVEPPTPIASTDSIASQKRFDAAIAIIAEHAQRDRKIREEKIQSLINLLSDYGNALDTGDSAQSQIVRAQIETLTTSIGKLPASLEHDLSVLHARASELLRWLMWSNNERRKAICAEIEALPPALHPDALATRIRELRDEWQKLSAASKPPEMLERRFQSLCNRTLKSTRPYFNKRDEVRKEHGASLHQLLVRADSITTDSADWKAMSALRIELGTALRSLDRVDPRERTTLAKRLKSLIEQLGTRIKTHDDEVASAKTKLIERAHALTESPNPRDVSRIARELQTEWTKLGNGRRSIDQKQWRDFRAACDAAFGKLDEQKKERESQATTARQQAAAIVEELETLSTSDASVEALRTSLREIDSRWESTAVSDHNLDQRYRQARDAVMRSISDSARRTRLHRFTFALQKNKLLRDAENGNAHSDTFAAQWREMAPASAEFESVLQKRFELLNDASATRSVDADDLAADILVRLEFLAGIDSPASEKQRRMDYQVQRLSARMRGGSVGNAENELAQLFAAWFALSGPFPQDVNERFDAATRVGMDNLP
jgi:exonuclease SbcC